MVSWPGVVTCDSASMFDSNWERLASRVSGLDSSAMVETAGD